MKPFFIGSTTIMSLCSDCKRGVDRDKHLPSKRLEENKLPRVNNTMGDYGERLVGEILTFFNYILYKPGKICWDELPNCGVTPDFLIALKETVLQERPGIGDLSFNEALGTEYAKLLTSFWARNFVDLYSYRERPQIKGVVEVKTTTIYQDTPVKDLYTADEFIRKLINAKHECIVGEEKKQSWMDRSLYDEFVKAKKFEWEVIVKTHGPHEDTIPKDNMVFDVVESNGYTKYKIPAGSAKVRLTVGSIGRQVFSEMMSAAQFSISPDIEDITGKLCFLQYRSPKQTPVCNCFDN
jgi:hypothetical protein